jgi:hypothetical protein
MFWQYGRHHIFYCCDSNACDDDHFNDGRHDNHDHDHDAADYDNHRSRSDHR